MPAEPHPQQGFRAALGIMRLGKIDVPARLEAASERALRFGALSYRSLRLTASVEDINYSQPQGLDKRLLLELVSCRWIKERQNILFTGPTGVGKSYLACALGNKARRDG